ncbi:proteasomal ubiquitin receptor ADRM1 homolog [Drosophila santomea]|uniref:proteasomal ubiquitin receptor ADRM1 homolog n=1 Tax=Drosophila santomea TaxID=129105 RepID=UPI00195385A1|nr:proteasomal ubiquitin receptor ADRM1 homolog [Drosophila santomea]
MAESEGPNLAEYKAGRMILLGKMVEPDERKGLLFVRRSAGDNQVHIHWMDRRSGAVELDIVATPGVLEFRHIDQCKTGRVYVLKYTRSPQRFFFWMQEPQADGDALFCQRVNELIASGERKLDESAAADGDVDTDVEHETRRGFGGSENPQVLADLLAGTPETWLPTRRSVTHKQSDDTVEVTPPLAFSDPHTDTELFDLTAVLRIYGVEAVENLLSCPLRREKLLAQLPKDPEAEDEQEDILEHMHSPQFNETLSYFSVALHSGVLRSILEPLFQHDHLEALDAAQVGDIERFLRELHHDERPAD